jgi:cytochrome P450
MAVVDVDFSEFQQHSERYSQQCRERGDLIRLCPQQGELSMYVVVDHAGCNELLRNEAGKFVHFADFFASVAEKSEVDQKIGEIFSRNLGNNSGLHLELRKDIRNHFNGGGVDQHIPYIEKTVKALAAQLADVAAANNGIVDMVEDFALPLTFLVTSHMIGLSFDSEQQRKQCIELAGQAIRLINLIAPQQDKITALRAHDELSEFILPQLEAFIAAGEQQERKDCLFYDFAAKVRGGEADKLDSYIELVNGLFQAGLGATGNFLTLCLHLLLEGNAQNNAAQMRAYFLDPARTDEEKREAVGEYVRVAQQMLGGIFPRYSVEGGKLKGADIPPNSLVYMSLASANLDDKAVDDALRVNPERIKIPQDLSKQALSERRAMRKEKSLSFSYGEHMCPGRRIALTIIRYALDELLTRYPNMAVEEMAVVSEIFGRPSEVTAMKVQLNATPAA